MPRAHAMMTRLHFVRHARAALAPATFPSLGTPLAPAGRADAETLAAVLAGSMRARPAALWSSDLPRAAETAEVIGAALGLVPRLDHRFREADPGDWAGLTTADLEATRPAEMAAWLADPAGYTPPGGESLSEMATRVREATGDLLAMASGADGPAFLVGHSGTGRLLLADALGLPLARALAIEIAPTALTTLDRYDDGTWSLRRLNWRPALEMP